MSSIDYNSIPETTNAVNETQDWSVVDINRFYATSDNCSFYAINEF